MDSKINYDLRGINLSRRGFFTLAAALGLAAVSEGLEGRFVRAWADAAGTTSYKIYVCNRTEVPIAFLDMGDPSNPASVVGARVTIASHHNGKVATGVTDENGVALISVSDLSEPPSEPEEGLPVEYSFFGSVLVEAEGYRVFETGKLRITGGQQVETPTEKLNGRPYVRCATIDGWDIQYAKSVTFAATSSNRETHEALIKVSDGSGAGYEGAQGGVDLSFGQVDCPVFSKELAFDGSGLAAASFAGTFFSTHADDSSGAFAPGKQLLLEAELTGDSANSFTMTTAADVAKGVVEDEAVEDKSYSIDTFVEDGASGDISYMLPESLPFLGGESVSVSGLLPSWPVSFALDPFGLLIAGVGRSGTLHRHGTKWQRDTFENSLQSYKDTRDEWSRNFKKWKDDRDLARLTGDKLPKTGKLAPTKSFDMSFQCGGLLTAQWGDHLSDTADSFRGDAQLYAILSGGFSATQQVVVMYVPLFVRFEASAAARAVIDVGVAVQRDTHDIGLSQGSSIAFTLQPEIALTMGVGVADLLSVGIRGAGYLGFYLNVPFQAPEDKPDVRFSIGAGVSASVVIQAALFKASVGLYSMDWPSLYDNWEASPAVLKSGQPASADSSSYEYAAYHLRRADGSKGYSESLENAGGLLQAGSSDLASFAVEAVPVSQSELTKTAEFKAAAKQAALMLSADGAGEDQLLAQGHDAYSYSPIARQRLRGAASGSMGEGSPSSALKSLGVNGAQMSSGLVYGEAFSDPRMKVVLVGANEVPWLFRILTTVYGSDDAPLTRTRLAVAKWSAEDKRWGIAQVIDFTPAYAANASGPARTDLFDYDFSVVSAAEVAGLGSTWADGAAVRVFLTSGTRSDDATQSMGDALAHTVGTFLSLGEDLSVKARRSFLDVYGTTATPAMVKEGMGSLFDDYKASTLVFPQIVSDGAGEGNVTAIMAFCRMAATAKGLADRPYVEIPVCAIMENSDGSEMPGSLTCPGSQQGTEVISAFVSERKLSVSMGVIGRSSGNANTVFLGAHYVTETLSGRLVKEFVIQRSKPGPIEQAQLFLGGTSASAGFVYPWRGVGLESLGGANALCAADGKLVARSFTKDIADPQNSVTQADLTLDKSIKLDAFALDQATGMLYYATTREGSVAGDIQDDGTRGAKAEVRDYRIWATRCITVAGKTGFIEPFPIIQTNEPIDELVFVPLDNSYAFMVNSITDMEYSQSDIVFYKLPYVRSVRLLDFQSVNRFVCAGETEAFEITVCNEGNVLVDSFSLLIRASLADGSAFEQCVPLDLRQTDKVVPLVQAEDASDVQNGNEAARSGDLTACAFTDPAFDLATSAGVLVPGKTRSYRFLWEVPEVFSGATDLEIVVLGNDEDGGAPNVAAAEAARFKSAQTISQLGDAFAHEPVRFGADVRTDGQEGVDGAATELSLTKSRYRYGDGFGDDDPTDDASGGSGNGSDASTIPGGSLASTGDVGALTAAGAVLLAGAGAAGVGFAAQQMRRVEDLDESLE